MVWTTYTHCSSRAVGKAHQNAYFHHKPAYNFIIIHQPLRVIVVECASPYNTIQ